MASDALDSRTARVVLLDADTRKTDAEGTSGRGPPQAFRNLLAEVECRIEIARLTLVPAHGRPACHSHT